MRPGDVLCNNMFHALDRGKISSMNFTLGDMLLYFFRGKEIYNPINGAEFMIPTEYNDCYSSIFLI